MSFVNYIACSNQKSFVPSSRIEEKATKNQRDKVILEFILSGFSLNSLKSLNSCHAHFQNHWFMSSGSHLKKLSLFGGH